MDWPWYIWDFFINYLFWAIVFFIAAYRFYIFYLIWWNIGSKFNSCPEISKLSKAKKTIITTLFLLVFLVIIQFVFNGKTIFTIIPLLIIIGQIYINGKLLGSYFTNFKSMFYYNHNKVLIYPIFILKFKRFLLIKWENIQKVKYFEKSKDLFQLEFTLKSNLKINRIYIDKNILHLYLDLFQKFQIEITNE